MITICVVKTVCTMRFALEWFYRYITVELYLFRSWRWRLRDMQLDSAVTVQLKSHSITRRVEKVFDNI